MALTQVSSQLEGELYHSNLKTRDDDQLRQHRRFLETWLAQLPKQVAKDISLEGRLRGLICDANPYTFYRGLIELAEDLRIEGKSTLTLPLLNLLQEELHGKSQYQGLFTQTERCLSLTQGGTSFSDKLQLFAEGVPREMQNYGMMAGMMAGSGALNLGRYGVARLFGNSLGLGGRVALGNTVGFLMEGMAFEAASHRVHYLQGKASPSFLEGLKGAYWMMGCLRLTGTTARTLLASRGFQGLLLRGGRQLVHGMQKTLPVLAEYSGIYFSNTQGWRFDLGSRNPNLAGIEAFLTLGNFKVVGGVLHSIPRYHVIQQQMQQELVQALHQGGHRLAQRFRSSTQRWVGSLPPGAQPGLRFAGALAGGGYLSEASGPLGLTQPGLVPAKRNAREQYQALRQARNVNLGLQGAVRPRSLADAPEGVYVGALLPKGFAKNLPEGLTKEALRVRCYGMEGGKGAKAGQESIEQATAYLTWLHPAFGKIMDAIAERGLTPTMRQDGQNYSHTLNSFAKFLDRRAEGWGLEIQMENRATPDILLHEAAHALPLSVLREIFAEVDLGIDAQGRTITLNDLIFPKLDPAGPYDILHAGTVEHGRLDEVMSFSLQAFSYQIERARGITPVFHHEMMSRIDDAWQQGGFQAVRQAFAHYLPHYEGKLGNQLAWMAAIAKTQGRIELTDKEVKDILKIPASQELAISSKMTSKLVENYLRNSGADLGVAIPPDYFTPEAILARINWGKRNTYTTAQVLAEVFDSLENFTAYQRTSRRQAPGVVRPIHPPPDATTHEPYTQLLSRLVESTAEMLRYEPDSLTRQQMDAMVSLARLMPAELSFALAQQLRPYLGRSHQDLDLILSLDLYEKGFHEATVEPLQGQVKGDLPAAAWERILNTVGPEQTLTLLESHWEYQRNCHRRFAEAFEVVGRDQLNLEVEGIDPAQYAQDQAALTNLHRLFARAELGGVERWARLGEFMLSEERSLEFIDTQHEIPFALEKSQRDELQQAQNHAHARMELLTTLRRRPLPEALSQRVEALWRQELNQQSEILRAWCGAIGAGAPGVANNHPHRMVLLYLPELPWKHLEATEVEQLVAELPAEYQGAIRGYAETYREGAWSDTPAASQWVQGQVEAMEQALDTHSIHFVAQVALFNNMVERFASKGPLEAEAAEQVADLVTSDSYVRVRWLQRLIDKHGEDKAYGMTEAKLQNPLIQEIHQLNSDEFMKEWAYTEKAIRSFLGWKYGHAQEKDDSFDMKHRLSYETLLLEQHNQALTLDPQNGDSLCSNASDDLELFLDDFSQQESHPDLILFEDDIVPYISVTQKLMAQAAYQGSVSGFQELQTQYVRLREAIEQIPQELSSEARRGGYEGRRHKRKENKEKGEFLHAQFTQPLWALDRLLELQQSDGIEESSPWFQRIDQAIARDDHFLSSYAFELWQDAPVLAAREEVRAQLLERQGRWALIQGLNKKVKPAKGFLQAVHGAPLADTRKDAILFEFFQPIFAHARYTGNVDIKLLQKATFLLVNEVPWAGLAKAPYYPDTEALMARELSQRPELMDSVTDVDLGLRLQLLGVSTFPLQRWTPWAASRFAPEHQTAALSTYVANHRARLQAPSHLAREGVPPIASLPATLIYRAQYLEDNQAGLMRLLSSANSEKRFAARLWLSYVLRGELELCDIDEAETVQFVLARVAELKKQETPISATAAVELLEMLLDYRDDYTSLFPLAHQLLQDPSYTPQERDLIFAKVTRGLALGNDVEVQRQQARAQSIEAERHFYEVFLSLNHSMHPGNRVSDRVLAHLLQSPTALEEYKRFDPQSGELEDIELALELAFNKLDEDFYSNEKYKWLTYDALQRSELLQEALTFYEIYMRAAVEDIQPRERNFLIELSKYGVRRIDFGVINQYRSRFSVLEDHSSYSPGVGQGHLAKQAWEAKIPVYLAYLETLGIPELFYVEEEDFRGNDGSIRKQQQKYLQSAWGEFAEIRARVNQHQDLLYRDRLAEAEKALPDFIKNKSGLERNLGTWAYAALTTVQKSQLQDRLKKAHNDEEREEALAEVANLHRLLQIASIYPGVPPPRQARLKKYQRYVPPRDPADVLQTSEIVREEANLGDTENWQVFVDRPIAEGTIGGVYHATYQGKPAASKFTALGKREGLLDSIDFTRRMIRFAQVSGDLTPGEQTSVDLLEFYEQELIEEMDLSSEPEKHALLTKVLPKGFVTPKIYPETAHPLGVTMEPLFGEDIFDLSPEQRKAFIREVDEKFLPKALATGIYHYDLHPGNWVVILGGEAAAEQEAEGERPLEEVGLYDVGRIVKLEQGTEEEPSENNYLKNFLWATMMRNTSEMKANLEKMGEVRNPEAFADIETELLAKMDPGQPMESLRQLYPQLARYGYRLDHKYFKVLFMYITWNGTKQQLLEESASGDVEED